MTDPLDDLDGELDASIESTMLVIEEDADGELSIDDPTGKLSDNDRIAMLWRALLLESGSDLVAALEAVHDEEDE